jgi:hypothetical protein
MKYATAIALLPLLVKAAPTGTGLAERDEPDNGNTVVKFDAFATGSTVPFIEGTGLYVGQENSTDVSLFRFADGGVYSIEAAQGEQHPVNNRLSPNGLCYGCKDESSGSAKRDALAQPEERTGIIIGLFALKVGIISGFLEGIFSILWAFLGFRKGYPTGCLNGYTGGNVWIGGPQGHQCSHRQGYVHYPNVPHIGWDNGYGGKYCGTYKQIQYWQWNDGTVCSTRVHRHRRRSGCDVPRRPQRPPVCNSCNDPSNDYWSDRNYNNWRYKNWWGYGKRDEIEAAE